jgi:galactokinase
MEPSFAVLFGREPTHAAFAHGRVNLIGEHTDYNGGFVLPTPIPQKTVVELAPRDDDVVAAFSTNYPERGVTQYPIGRESNAPRSDWRKYVMGATHTLAKNGSKLGGFDLRVESNVPVGSGLSSSAALEVALLRALRSAFNLAIDDRKIALLGQSIENDYVGARVGVMDQMVASVGEFGSALFLDARDLSFERVPLPQNADLVVINSGVEHQHSSGDYNTRRAECERACDLLGVASLRDVGAADLSRIELLPEPFSRRAWHVVSENQRVLDAVAAMRRGDLAELGRLFCLSHASQRDDYLVSIPEIDLLVELACKDARTLGARLTGGGFGGSIVAITKKGMGSSVAGEVVDDYLAKTGLTASILVEG